MSRLQPFFHTCVAQIVVKNLLNAKSESVKIVASPHTHAHTSTLGRTRNPQKSKNHCRATAARTTVVARTSRKTETERKQFTLVSIKTTTSCITPHTRIDRTHTHHRQQPQAATHKHAATYKHTHTKPES